MDPRPQIRASEPHPIYHNAPCSEDMQGQLGAEVLRELLALPPAVLNAPVFRKVKLPLEAYRRRYAGR